MTNISPGILYAVCVVWLFWKLIWKINISLLVSLLGYVGILNKTYQYSLSLCMWLSVVTRIWPYLYLLYILFPLISWRWAWDNSYSIRYKQPPKATVLCVMLLETNMSNVSSNISDGRKESETTIIVGGIVVTENQWWYCMYYYSWPFPCLYSYGVYPNWHCCDLTGKDVTLSMGRAEEEPSCIIIPCRVCVEGCVAVFIDSNDPNPITIVGIRWWTGII